MLVCKYKFAYVSVLNVSCCSWYVSVSVHACVCVGVSVHVLLCKRECMRVLQLVQHLSGRCMRFPLEAVGDFPACSCMMDARRLDRCLEQLAANLGSLGLNVV